MDLSTLRGAAVARTQNPALDVVLGRELPVLDHGFVSLRDYLGDDTSVVRAARVSYGEGTRTVSDDRSLIRYMLGHDHTSPFEHIQLTFHIKAPIFVARQVMRHRTAKINELSGRYSELPVDTYVPDRILGGDASNKQGSAAPLDAEVCREAHDDFGVAQYEADAAYRRLLGLGVAREIARTVKSVATYTEWYWTIDLHNLLHFLRLRLDEHSQWETRQFAEAIAAIVKIGYPLTYEAFEDYRLGSVTFSKHEAVALAEAIEYVRQTGTMPEGTAFPGLGKREIGEFLGKLRRLTEGRR